MSNIGLETVARERNEVGEGPVWLVDQQRLMWVDITRNLIQWFNPEDRNVDVLDVGKHVGAVVPTTSNKLVAAVPGEFLLIDPSKPTIESIAQVETDKPGNRMNDGKCDSRGRFWAGTMAYDVTPDAAALYRLNTDRTVDVVVTPVTLSNGLDWSLDDGKMYYVDSVTQRVDIFDFDPTGGQLSNRRPLVHIPPEHGTPDGITVDSEGYIWVALWGGSSVRRFAPNGMADLVVKLPVSQVTSCAFGGRDFKDLYITSASFGLSEDELRNQPDAGSLFRCKPGPAGRPAHSFSD